MQGFWWGGWVVCWDGRTKIPVVEVIAPDGRKSLWAAAVAMAKAVAAVKEVIPLNYVATLTKRRLTITRKSELLRRAKVRTFGLSPPPPNHPTLNTNPPPPSA